MALYTMNQLQAEIHRTPQSIRQVLKKNEKLIELLPKHKIVKPNKQVYYDQEILIALKEYYGLLEINSAIAEEVGGGDENTENRENPTNNPLPPVDTDKQPSAAEEAEITALEEQIEALQKELEQEKARREKEVSDLEKQLQDKEAERLHFIGENSKLLSILAAEKQEKDKLLLLLPPADTKKSVWGKFKRLFTSKKEAAKSE